MPELMQILDAFTMFKQDIPEYADQDDSAVKTKAQLLEDMVEK